MTISRLEVFVMAMGGDRPDKGGVEAAGVRAQFTRRRLVWLSEVFRVPPGVVQATLALPTHILGVPDRAGDHATRAPLAADVGCLRAHQTGVAGRSSFSVRSMSQCGTSTARCSSGPCGELLGGSAGRSRHRWARGGDHAVLHARLDVWGGEPMFAQQVGRARRNWRARYRASRSNRMMSTRVM